MGDYLRAARRRRRISIERAAEETRIRADFLMRMESDEFDFLAPTYVRGFLKSYARYLRVDPAPLMEEFDRRFGVGRFETQQIMALERHGRKQSAPRKKMNSWGVAAIFATVVIVILAGIGLVQGEPDEEPQQVASASESPSPESTPTPEVSPSPSEDAQVALTDGITVEVVAVDGACWVFAAEDGQDVNPAGDTIEQGSSMVFEADKKVFLRLGAPWAVELIVNGQNIGSPGGQDPVSLNFPDDLDTL